jgi:ubiquinone/menaquinone biosynthesis C-methylase UbiE
MTLPAGWLVRLNKGRFHFAPPPDDPVSYARWEFTEGGKIWNRFFASRVDIRNKDVVDLGCGPGGKTCYLATLGPRKIVGIDFQCDLIQKAESARESITPPEFRALQEFVCIDAIDLPFPDSYFDVVTCSDAFEHFKKPNVILSEAARVLKPGGLFAIDFAQWGSYNGSHMGEIIKTPWCQLFWSEAEIVKAINELAGMEKRSLKNSSQSRMLDRLVEKCVDMLHNGLNHMSLVQFEKYLRDEKRLKVRWMKKTAAYPILWPFIFVPGVREFTVARNVYVVERTGY